MDNTEASTQRPPATPTGELWDRFCRRDDPGAATRWFPGTEPPTTSKERNPYGVKDNRRRRGEREIRSQRLLALAGPERIRRGPTR